MTDTAEITVIVRGGVVHDVEIKGKAYVVVHDYDVDQPHGRNEDGELYVIAGEYGSVT
jgi:hypothetical protein